MGEELRLQEVTGQHDPRTLAARYADLIRRQPVVCVDPVRLPNPRRPLQALAIIGATTLYVSALSFLLQPAVDPAAPLPAAVLALGRDAACADRQAEIVRAIAAYRREHGTVPDRLERLTPRYLTEPATDPASGRPYQYAREGRAVVVACPDPYGHS